ncbi:MAG: alanine--tRNA ligase [Deltaproteobacteria bacterium]|nr:alanine--tRNA ligase [Deltaproteobacteria bacterium]
MESTEIRKRFIEFFKKSGHEAVPSSSLIPRGDPTLLFTNAGMVQFKGVFMNEETRDYRRAVSCQRCVRAGGKHNDLENVGVTARHHTFFEMLGNFSFGDYFKEGAIDFAWAFLTEEMRLPKEKLWITVFETDDEAAAIWEKKAGVSKSRIVRMGAKDNFWSMGDAGPCGPCSEILIDQGKEVGCGRPECAVGCDCDRFLEIWNLVFMQYNRGLNGELTPLPKPCIDTGMGLERLSAVQQGKHSNYESDLFMPIITRIEEISGVKYGSDRDKDTSMRAIADHARAITFLITDGVLPGNVDRAYVLRRIIRRAARHGKFLGIKDPFIYMVSGRVIELMGDIYPEIIRAKELVAKATKGEEERFFETLERGLSMLDEEVASLKNKKETIIPGSVAFKLYDTYGFPADLTADIIKKDGLTIDEEGFNKSMAEQKAKARLAWKGAAEGAGKEIYKGLSSAGLKSTFVGYQMDAASSRILCIIKNGISVETAQKGDTVEIVTEETPFYGESGGQAGDTGIIVGVQKMFTLKVADTARPLTDLTVHHCTIEQGSITVDDTVELIPDLNKRTATRRNHTATHILHASLRKLLGEHVRQAGSLVNEKGLRFDFSHFEALKDDDIKKIEELANRAVLENIEVTTDVLPYQTALEKGALAFFGEKYGDMVRLVSVPGVSAELCGGTHVKRSGDIGLIKITAESSVASGTRRLEAVTGEGALNAVIKAEDALKESASILKSPKAEVPGRIRKLLEAQRELEKEIERLKAKGKATGAVDLVKEARAVNGVNVIAALVEATDPAELRSTADALKVRIGSGIIILASKADSKAFLLAAVTKDLTNRFKAGELIKRLAPIIGGKGGGRDDMAQAGGSLPEKLDEALKAVYKAVEEVDGK